jgi:hypothetical protein
MNRRPDGENGGREGVWRKTCFGLSALMAAFALVDLDAGRLAGAAGNAGVCCLMLSLLNQFPIVRAIVRAATRRASRDELQRESEKLRGAQPWTERLARVGWALLFASLALRALGVD